MGVDMLSTTKLNKDERKAIQGKAIWNGTLDRKVYKNVQASQNTHSTSSSEFQVGNIVTVIFEGAVLGYYHEWEVGPC